ncbi:hypothetical protein [Micromonospora luteifusca]|uniref:hypothetical protein n=1 Tax=Micromonospora luteifusca TaxID=709860 RepID=UPI0033BB4F21
MKRSFKLGLAAASAAAVIFGTSAPVQASSNLGWLYTVGASGGVFFDADLNGYPNVEKITVCDNKSDGRGLIGRLYFDGITGNGDGLIDWIKDPSNDGACTSMAYNMIAEETPVKVEVCEYMGSSERLNCAIGFARA